MPWHESDVPIPGKVKELKLAVRQWHPYLAEYEYKVSGKLPNGKTFTQKLAAQNGGLPALNVDFIPGRPGAEGYVRFQIVEAQPGVIPNFLNLSNGRIEPKPAKTTNAKSLGYIDNHMNFYPPSIWGQKHSLSERYFHNSKFKDALQEARKGLEDARATKNNEQIATSLLDLALALQIGKLGASKEIEDAYAEAIQKAYNNPEKLPSDKRIAPSIKILEGFAMFYEKDGKFAEAEPLVEQRAVLAEKLKDEKLTTDIKFDLARLKLRQNHTAEATSLISTLQSASGKFDVERQKAWQDLYPYVALLEHDIEERFAQTSAGQTLSVTATFEIPPKYHITNLKILTQDGLHAGFPASMSIHSAGAHMRAPFPIDKTVYCEIAMTASGGKANVSITRKP